MTQRVGGNIDNPAKNLYNNIKIIRQIARPLEFYIF